VLHAKLVVDNLQVGTTDTNINNSIDLLAGVTLPFAAADLLAELLHVVEHLVDALDNALAINLHGLIGGVAESNVVDRALLSEVDLLTREHVIAKLLEACLLRELNEELNCLISDKVLGEVEQGFRAVGFVLEGVAELLKSLEEFS
jgi:hypothetical protein